MKGSAPRGGGAFGPAWIARSRVHAAALKPEFKRETPRYEHMSGVVEPCALWHRDGCERGDVAGITSCAEPSAAQYSTLATSARKQLSHRNLERPRDPRERRQAQVLGAELYRWAYFTDAP